MVERSSAVTTQSNGTVVIEAGKKKYPSELVPDSVSKEWIQRNRRKNSFNFENAHFPTKAELLWINVKNSVFDFCYPLPLWVLLIFVSWQFNTQLNIGEDDCWFCWLKHRALCNEGDECCNLHSIYICSFVIACAVSLFTLYGIRLFLRYFVFHYKGYLTPRNKKPSLRVNIGRAVWWALWQITPPRLWTCDSFLPKQPVPGLDSTVQKYVNSMKHIVEESEFKKLQNDADSFTKTFGFKLRLILSYLYYGRRNYVTDSWEKFYLMHRDSLIVYSSICCVDVWKPLPCSQAERAARLMYFSACNMLSFGRGESKPLAHGIIFSGFYHRLYGGVRLPGKDEDSWCIRKWARHSVVFSNGCFWKMDVFCPKTGRLYSVPELTAILDDILERPDKGSVAEQRLCSLTMDRRASWAENRERFFIQRPENRDFLNQIEECLVFMVLDEDNFGYDEGNDDQLSYFIKKMLTGNGADRWVDKPVNFIVGRNGRAGACSEHSVADGAEYFHITENKFFADHFIPAGVPIRDKSSLQLAQRLHVKVSDEMSAEIERCYGEVSKLVNDVDMSSKMILEWGKGRLKKGGCSPDAFMQMAIQLAYFRESGKFVQTYESASARFFDFSRTETLRTVGDESAAFVRAMVSSDVSKNQKLTLMKAACEAHVRKGHEAMTGDGVDRHMFMLCAVSHSMKYASPFLDFYKNQPWILSTTQTGYVTQMLNEDESKSQCWLGGAFGATSHDGYGIGYRFIGNHSIVFHITSYKSSGKTNGPQFRLRLVEAMTDMTALFTD